ncbi:GGDEF domain-containing protein [Pseudoxanthomonas sp. F37]|uniref:GGDEF domain-containing protein n=1 Tax=Pseudoxanthomonas TaxID=83618 RepID=UPI001FD1B9E4|nr:MULTISPECIES: GGDEF domain-containing protein [Pseudoxanthomonas]UOV05212.1 GGDEF domain-containing protein [Pseudoxanthomonas mexicana]UOV10211.1 GGDEF domain-containing protein [Pseudoxanthomonas sp. F37]
MSGAPRRAGAPPLVPPMPVGVLHSLRGFFARESIQGLDGAEREDLTQAQLRATRPIVSGVLLCGAVLLAIITVFEMAGATPSIGYPGWLQMLVASLVAGCAAAVARLPQWQHRLVLTLVATLLLGIFMSMPLPGATGQLALRTGLFQLLPLALMALMVRPVSLLAFALLIVAMAQLRIVLYGAPGTGSALYWLYTLTTIGFGLVLAGYRSDFAASAWRMRRRLVQQASTDPVTGLLNRNGWSERAEAAHARAAAGVPLALVVLDIDFFKRINDRLGHDGGDAVLQRLGAILQARAGARGCAARIGGEEFAVLLEGHDARSARTFAERVRSEFGGEHEGAVTTLSAGVAEHRPGETLRELMRRADLALYSAKHEGRDRVCVAPVS